MSEPFCASDAVHWAGGAQRRGDAQVRLAGVSIDTRSLEPGSLFVAIAGSIHDAHDFLANAVAAGAAGLMIERGRALPAQLPEALVVIEVDDTTCALGALACGHRGRFDGPVVAITGSNGKTSTKEMCAAILCVAAPCLKTAGNLNNEFGLPLTLLRRDTCDRSVVVELGMNHRGEIARLTAIAQPNVGVITNIGTAHIEYLGSRAEIAREKGDLLAQLPADGVAVVDGDDPLALEQSRRSRARTLRFGRSADADVRAENVRCLEGRGFHFDLCAPEGRIGAEVAGLGETAIDNALAAAAGALAAGAPLANLPVGLARYRPVAGRLEPLPLPRGGVLINDSYNANPQSMEVALRVLAAGEYGASGRAANGVQRIAVLGDMGELGESGAEAHRETGRLAARLGIDHVFAIGERAELVAEGARSEGMNPCRVHVARDWRETGEAVRARLAGRDRVLIKGSRSMRMERIVEVLLAREGDTGGDVHRPQLGRSGA
jgi:UDP-N-acetylmuramoyl-tripeptide--D-alanyl-D-alanine ligase